MHEDTTEADVIHREELYRLIWEKPATELAKSWDISSSLLTRICRELDVPKPTLGHWTRVAYGKKFRKPSLPKLKDGGKENWRINRAGVLQQREVARRRIDAPEIQSNSEIERILESDLDEHKWTKATRSATKLGNTTREGRLWQARDKKHFEITTSADHLERALEFLNRLLCLAECEGIVIEHEKEEEDPSESWRYRQPREPSKTGMFQWEGQQIGLRINEKFKRTEKKDAKFWDRYEYHPTGMLEFMLMGTCGGGGRRTWKDGKRQRIEDFYLQIIAAVKEAAVDKREYLIKRRIEEERRRKIQAVERALQMQEYREDRAFEKIQKEASLLAEADRIRAYADSAEQRFAERYGVGAVAPESDIGLWLQWIRIRADRIDPLSKDTQPWKKGVSEVIKLEEKKSRW